MAGLDADVELLIHSDTTDGSTTFVDSSLVPHAITAFGGAHHEVDQYKFGATSIYNDGVWGSGLQVAASTDFNFGTGDFTVDFWVYFAAGGAEQTLYDYGQTAGNGLLIRTDSSTPPKITTFVGGNYKFLSAAIATGGWHHVAVIRESGTVKLFIDGSLDSSSASTEDITRAATAVGIAAEYSVQGSPLNGYMDEVRVSHVARWSGNFTPPTEPYSAEEVDPSITVSSTGGVVVGGSTVSAFYDGYATWVSTVSISTSGDRLTATKIADTGAYRNIRTDIGVLTGKYYWEVTSQDQCSVGVVSAGTSSSVLVGGTVDSYGYYSTNGNKFTNNVGSAYGSPFSPGSVIGVALDMTAGKIFFSVNGVWQNSGDPVVGTGEAFSGLSGPLLPSVMLWEIGHETVLRTNPGDMSYSPPEGYSPIIALSVLTTNSSGGVILGGETEESHFDGYTSISINSLGGAVLGGSSVIQAFAVRPLTIEGSIDDEITGTVELYSPQVNYISIAGSVDIEVTGELLLGRSKVIFSGSVDTEVTGSISVASFSVCNLSGSVDTEIIGGLSLDAGGILFSLAGEIEDEIIGSMSLRSLRVMNFTGETNDEITGGFNVFQLAEFSMIGEVDQPIIGSVVLSNGAPSPCASTLIFRRSIQSTYLSMAGEIDHSITGSLSLSAGAM